MCGDPATWSRALVSPEAQTGSLLIGVPGGAEVPRPHTWLWAVAALVFVIALNPVMAERYVRSLFIAPGGCRSAVDHGW